MLHHEGFICVFTQPSLHVCLPPCPGHWSNQLLSSLKPATMKCLSARWTCVCVCVPVYNMCMHIYPYKQKHAHPQKLLDIHDCSQHVRELWANSCWICRQTAGAHIQIDNSSFGPDMMSVTIYSRLWQIKIYMTPTGQGCCMNPSQEFDKRHQWAVFSSLQLKWLIISRTSAVFIH